jgi:predicted DNA-binding protein YlxM (UPF0122 family)
MVKSGENNKAIDLSGMIDKYGLTAANIMQYATDLLASKVNNANNKNEQSQIKMSLAEANKDMSTDAIINTANITATMKKMMTSNDEVKLQAAGLHALICKESDDLKLASEQAILNTLKTVVNIDLTGQEMASVYQVTNMTNAHAMIKRHQELLMKLEKSLTVLKNQKDRLGKVMVKAQIMQLQKQGANMAEAKQALAALVPGARQLGSEYIAPGVSCADIYSVGDLTRGVKWIHPSNSVTSYFTKETYCDGGFDLVGKSSSTNTIPFTFMDDIETNLLNSVDATGNFAQFDLTGYSKYTSYMVQVKTLDGTKARYLRTTCPISQLGSICSTDCPCETSNDAIAFKQGTAGDAIPSFGVLVFVKNLAQQ